MSLLGSELESCMISDLLTTQSGISASTGDAQQPLETIGQVRHSTCHTDVVHVDFKE